MNPNPSVNLQDLLQAAYLVKAAYVNPSIRSDNTQGMVAYYPEDRVCTIACAGSNDPKDWQDNLNIFNRKYIGDGRSSAARVSAGFHRHAEVFSLSVLTEMKRLGVPDDAKLLLIGHSLGAAAITLAICLTPRFNRPSNEAVVFASPPVGNQGWVNHFNQNCRVRLLRVARDGDPVPVLPFWWRHVGREFRLPSVTPGFDHPMDAYIASILASIQG